MSQNLSRAYFTNSVKSATPGQLVIMLYDGLLRFAADARDAMQEDRSSAEMISRSIRILTELNTCLRHDVAPEFCDRLSKLYEFYTMELSRAMHRNQPQIITAILPMIASLRDAWQDAEKNLEPNSTPPSPQG